MATKKVAYDHPAITTVQHVGMEDITGSGGTSRYCTWANAIAKSVALKPATAGTSADTVTVLAVTGTATRTLGVTTFASAATAGTRLELTTGSNTLTALDELRVVKGTDATSVIAVGVELVTRPEADLTDTA